MACTNSGRSTSWSDGGVGRGRVRVAGRGLGLVDDGASEGDGGGLWWDKGGW